MRARRVAALLAVVVAVAACGRAPEPPSVEASEVEASESASPATEPDEVRLVELRASDQFDEFAEHERAAKADGARLAWENFAPIVDGKRVEWTNKAELWDSIAPKIRDEALLLGPEYRKPLWNQRNAIPNAVTMAWNEVDTEGRGDFVEFGVTYRADRGPAELYWGALIQRDSSGRGRVTRFGLLATVHERDHVSAEQALEARRDAAWRWIFREGPS